MYTMYIHVHVIESSSGTTVEHSLSLEICVVFSTCIYTQSICVHRYKAPPCNKALRTFIQCTLYIVYVVFCGMHNMYLYMCTMLSFILTIYVQVVASDVVLFSVCAGACFSRP